MTIYFIVLILIRLLNFAAKNDQIDLILKISLNRTVLDKFKRQ
jgi:hypothetical protein